MMPMGHDAHNARRTAGRFHRTRAPPIVGHIMIREFQVANDAVLDEAVAAIPYGRRAIEGIATAGQPSAASLTALRAAGYRTVIDLRAQDEPRGYDEPAAARAAGLDYIAVPVSSPVVPAESFDRVRELLRDPARRPALIHCATANRVGGLVLPYLMLDAGLSSDDALALARRVGLRSPEYARAALDYVHQHPTVAREERGSSAE